MSYNLRQRQSRINYTAPQWKIRAVRLSNRTNLTKLDRFNIPDEAIFAFTRHKRQQKRAAEADPKYQKQPFQTGNIAQIWLSSPKFDRRSRQWMADVEWHGISGHYWYPLLDLINDALDGEGICPKMALHLQMNHQNHATFTDWYKAQSVVMPRRLSVGDFVYDFVRRVYYRVTVLPNDNELYVWGNFSNYYAGTGEEYDPYTVMVGSGDGIGSGGHALYSGQIIVIASDDVKTFYFGQLARDQFNQCLADGIRLNRNTRAKALRFFESVQASTVWLHFLKGALDAKGIEYTDDGHCQKWSMSCVDAHRTFPALYDSYFGKIFGNKRVFVDQMDFVLSHKTNKLRIYGIVFTENLQTGNINGSDIDKKRLRRR